MLLFLCFCVWGRFSQFIDICFGRRLAPLTTRQAFRYYRRAAVLGHPSSMTEISLRLLRKADVFRKLQDEAEGNKSKIEDFPGCKSNEEAANCIPNTRDLKTRIAELHQSAYRWTSLAAELGDARGTFDQAYMLQFGVGIEQNEQLLKLVNIQSKVWFWLGLRKKFPQYMVQALYLFRCIVYVIIYYVISRHHVYLVSLSPFHIVFSTLFNIFNPLVHFLKNIFHSPL